MDYLKLWGLAYINPRAFADKLNLAPAPKWGFFAAFQRGLMDGLFTFLPVYLLGRIPPTPSHLSVFPTESYYRTLIFLAPIVLLAEWLTSSALIHLILRLSGRKSDMDKLLNISGFVALAIGSVLVVWDAAWLILGGMTQNTLGISHLVINIWAVVITTIALKRMLDVPVWLGILLNLVGMAVAMPFAIMFMRSPL
jgi:hypothetical protein